MSTKKKAAHKWTSDEPDPVQSEPVVLEPVTRAPHGPFVLRQAWIDGTNDEVKFELTCGAGLGNPLLLLRVEVGDKSVTEYIDMSEAVIPWVNRLVELLKESKD